MTSQIKQTMEKQPVALRALYTAIIFLGHVSMGMISGVGGPSMVDLRYLLGNVSAKEAASTTDISLSSTFLTVGSAFGGFLSFAYKWSLLSPYLNRQFVASILSILSALAVAYTSQISSIPLFYLLSIIIGIGLGNNNAIAITWLIEMWSGRVLAAILQALQLSFGIGSILGPLIIRPRLHGYMNATDVTAMNATIYQGLIAQRRISLTGPYIIIGAFLAFVGLMELILYISVCFRYHNSSEISVESESSPESTSSTSSVKLFESPHNRTQLLCFLAFLVIIFAGNNSAERAFLNFQETYLQSLDSFKVSASEAAAIGSITATSYTVGRGVNILVSMVLSAGNLLLLHYTLGLAAFLGLLYTTQSSLLMVQINSALIGYAFSAIMPAMFTYINLYSTVDDRRNALFNLALSLPSIFTPPLIGHYIEAIPSILIYISLSLLIVSACAFLLVRFWLVKQTEAKEMTKQLRAATSNY